MNAHQPSLSLEKSPIDYLSWTRIDPADARRHLAIDFQDVVGTACGLAAPKGAVVFLRPDRDGLPCERCLSAVSRAMDLAFPE